MLLFNYLSLNANAYNQLRIVSHFNCSFIDKDFCKLIETKPFSNEEYYLIASELNNLQQKGLSHLLNQVSSNGTTEILRATYGFTLGLSLTEPLVRQSNHFAFHDSRKGWIVLLDLFFNHPVKQDPLSNVPLKSIIFLHELVHAFDSFQQLSRNPNFLSWAGFSLEGPVHEYIQVSRQDKEAMIGEIITLKEQNLHYEADARERLLATQHHIPRLYSMKSPEEALADLTAYLFYEPYSISYIKPEIVKYIDTNILHGARNY